MGGGGAEGMYLCSRAAAGMDHMFGLSICLELPLLNSPCRGHGLCGAQCDALLDGVAGEAGVSPAGAATSFGLPSLRLLAVGTAAGTERATVVSHNNC